MIMPATLRDREEESQTDTMDATCNIWSSANLAFFFHLSGGFLFFTPGRSCTDTILANMYVVYVRYVLSEESNSPT